LSKQTTYKKDNKKSGGLLRTSWTATHYLDRFSRLRGQLSGKLTTDRQKRKEKSLASHFCPDKNRDADTQLAHCLLPLFIFLMEWQKAKSQLFASPKKKKINIVKLYVFLQIK